MRRLLLLVFLAGLLAVPPAFAQNTPRRVKSAQVTPPANAARAAVPDALRYDPAATAKPSRDVRPLRGLDNRHIPRYRSVEAFKAARSQGRVTAALDALARAAEAAPAPEQNVFAKAVEAAEAGATHGEICACLRRQVGFGEPLILT